MSYIIKPFKTRLFAVRPERSRMIRSAIVSLNHHNLSANFGLGNRSTTPKQQQIFTPVATLVTGAQIPKECAMHSEPVAQLPRDAQFYERVKQAMQTYTTDELKLLISLPSSLCTDSHMGDEPYWYPATKHCASLEICATLVGQKPCTLFTTTASDPKIYLGLVESV